MCGQLGTVQPMCGLLLPAALGGLCSAAHVRPILGEAAHGGLPWLAGPRGTHPWGVAPRGPWRARCPCKVAFPRAVVMLCVRRFGVRAAPTSLLRVTQRASEKRCKSGFVRPRARAPGRARIAHCLALLL